MLSIKESRAQRYHSVTCDLQWAPIIQGSRVNVETENRKTEGRAAFISTPNLSTLVIQLEHPGDCLPEFNRAERASGRGDHRSEDGNFGVDDSRPSKVANLRFTILEVGGPVRAAGGPIMKFGLRNPALRLVAGLIGTVRESCQGLFKGTGDQYKWPFTKCQ